MIGQQAAQNPVHLSVFTLPIYGYRLTFWMIYPMRFFQCEISFLLLWVPAELEKWIPGYGREAKFARIS